MMPGKNGKVMAYFTKKWQGSLLVTHIPPLDPLSGSTHGQSHTELRQD